MNRLCNLHPESPAQWECRQCSIAWCNDCIDENTIHAYGIAGAQKAQYYCPTCTRPVKKIRLRKGVQSSRADIRALFLQPLQVQPFLFMISISILSAIVASAGLHPVFLPLFWGALLPLAITGLQITAKETPLLPKLTKLAMLDTVPDVFKHFIVFLLVFATFVALVDVTGMFAGLLYLCLMLALIPAVVTILLLTERLRSALHPRLIITTVRKLGETYVIPAILLPIFLILSYAVGSWMEGLLSSDLQRISLTMAASYFTLVSYLLIGHMVHRCQETLVTVSAFDGYFAREQASVEESSQKKVLKIVDLLIAEDRLDDAIEYVENKTSEFVFDCDLAQRYYDLLKTKRETNKLMDHAKVYLDLLAAGDKKDKMCEVYVACQSEDPLFAPSPSTLFKIARRLNNKGQAQEAASAYCQFATFYRDSSFAPKSLFLAATILNEQLREPEKAVAMLKEMVNRYPDYQTNRVAREYLKTLMQELRQKNTRPAAPVYELNAVKSMT